jgi:hypothetical protein
MAPLDARGPARGFDALPALVAWSETGLGDMLAG